ncbi:MAG TPA: CTP synthase [Desulfobacterales bacterium]|nr:CTP synthase [Desulfobacterales bacterium]
MSRYIFVTGGVCSGLGKGVASGSIASLLENRGYAVRMIKIDPYLNVDAGTMNPFQHGEVYVTDDGAETDLDLGNYSRFTTSPLGRDNSITTGQIYQAVISREREGRFLGKTVQVIPHITDEIKARIFRIGEQPGVDVTMVEVGGTVGDIESIPFLEAARQFIHDIGRENVLFVHLTLVPVVYMGEPKTKPTQHSVRELREIGIQPDVLLIRSHHPLEDDLRRKISLFTNVDKDAVFSAYDVRTTIYEIPLVYAEQKLDEIVVRKLHLPSKGPARDGWRAFVDRFVGATRTAKIAIVGKYTDLHDSYISIFEALLHGAVANDARVDLVKFEGEELEEGRDLAEVFKDCDGMLVPGGFGSRGIEGMIRAARFAREAKLPYFGICLGLQIMVVEYARAKLGLADANSTEFAPDSKNPVVSLLEEQVDVKNYGGTMRLGRGDSHLMPNTRIAAAYGRRVISERHRHRYEVSNRYRKPLEDAGLVLSALTADESLVEAVEWPDHPWGVGVQFHPEFTSRPTEAGPLFAAFVQACLEKRR